MDGIKWNRSRGDDLSSIGAFLQKGLWKKDSNSHLTDGLSIHTTRLGHVFCFGVIRSDANHFDMFGTVFWLSVQVDDCI
jgi:hypothetical protein